MSSGVRISQSQVQCTGMRHYVPNPSSGFASLHLSPTFGAFAVTGRPTTRLFRLVPRFGARCGRHWLASSANSRWKRVFASDAPP